MSLYRSGEGNRKIMVIEDNGITLSQIQDFLSAHGYLVIPCQDAGKATRILDEEIPDLIVVDVMMPEISGYDFCKWVRSQPRIKTIPLIFVTALSSLENKLTGLKIGGDDYLTKPFELKELLARIEVIIQRMKNFHELSMRDELTSAFNRRYFNERLEEEISRSKRTGRPFSIVLMDIDFFKQINDHHGHCVGDYVLVQFVDFLQNQLRKSDLVARLGGEEFVLLLPDTNSSKAYLLVEHLRKILAENTVHYDEYGVKADIQFTFSAGIACCAEHAAEAEILVALADRALYHAKSSGRNTTKITI